MRSSLTARTTIAIVLATALPVGLAACGDEESTAPATTTTMATDTVTTGTTMSTAPATAGTTPVVLGGESEFVITIPKSLPAGARTFDVRNEGAMPHELVILRTDVKAADLPVEGAVATETGRVAGTADIPSGGTATLEADLAPGHYVVLCNVPGHYQGGMYADLTMT
jgi:uncharacterized cupredoxin-like copper-binding protein